MSLGYFWGGQQARALYVERVPRAFLDRVAERAIEREKHGEREREREGSGEKERPKSNVARFSGRRGSWKGAETICPHMLCSMDIGRKP